MWDPARVHGCSGALGPLHSQIVNLANRGQQFHNEVFQCFEKIMLTNISGHEDIISCQCGERELAGCTILGLSWGTRLGTAGSSHSDRHCLQFALAALTVLYQSCLSQEVAAACAGVPPVLETFAIGQCEPANQLGKIRKAEQQHCIAAGQSDLIFSLILRCFTHTTQKTTCPSRTAEKTNIFTLVGPESVSFYGVMRT